MSDQAEKIIPQPDQTIPLPLVTSTGAIKGHTGVTFVAGEGAMPSDIMFISPCISVQEASKYLKSQDGGQGSRVQPRYLRSDAGVMMTDIFDQEGISLHKFYYTALIKWLLPKAERSKLNKDTVRWALPSLEEEIRLVKPKIIVCIGKTVFDMFSGVKLAVSDAKGGWFYNEKFNARIYYLEDQYKLVTNPEFIEKFRIDAREISRTYKEISNVDIGRVPLEYRTITSTEGIKELLSIWRDGDHKVISVDCEWAGNNHIDGKLRSTQFCWAPGKACYIRWMDDKGNYVFDTSYAEAGKLLSTWLDREDVKYIGHHWAADAPWLHHVLGLKWYEKCIFDTEFAQQTANENEDLSLDRIAMKYTDLGRYDLPLNLWVKQNKALMVDGGYGTIPDEILIIYGCQDVDATFRAWPLIRRSLEAQNLVTYYETIFNPFVTDVFTSFAIEGLPMDVSMMDELRELYSFARDKMAVLLKEEIHADAKMLVFKSFINVTGPGPGINLYSEFMHDMSLGDQDAAWNLMKKLALKPDDVPRLKHLFDHYVTSADFNIRSSIHLKRWLFNVKGYEPIKSTNNKEKGLPSTSWDKVKTLPIEARKNYNPAVDKQTIQILAEQHGDMLLRRLLQLNAVGNICKAFLKEAEVDEDGNLIKENGLHFFLCSDSKIHGQYSTTETARPRSWKPNSLNWPSYVNKMISSGIAELFAKLKERSELPDKFEKYLEKNEKDEYVSVVPSIRACVKAPPGYCFVESDYQTAELRGLAFISGDSNLIDIICNPDENFGIDVNDNEKKLRLAFPDGNIIPAAVQEEHKHLLVSRESELLKRNTDGSIVHPKQDLHWSLAEMAHGKPREILDEKKDRNSAKIGNFSSNYGASPSTIERKIEQEIGKKPVEGTGERILKAIEKRQPVAHDFLIKMERLPQKHGQYRAASGRIRHFATHGDKYMDQLDEDLVSGMFKSMGRECRCYAMQESVAATAARAGKGLLAEYRNKGMMAQVITILYDSVVTLCPLSERFEVARLHQKHMTDLNTWTYHGREFNYPIDTLFCYRWSDKPTKAEKAQLADKTWKI